MYSFKIEDKLYDWISCLEKDRLYFGPLPNQLMIDKLIDEKFDIIVNLTMNDEVISFNNESNEEYISYKIPKNKYLYYGIKDNDIPLCPISYCSFILKLFEIYQTNKKIYIHCRGGHGRSGMVSTSLLLTINNKKNIKDVIEYVNKSHIDRVILREKWKNKNTPFNYNQYSFLLKIHKNIYINMNNKYYNWLIFNDQLNYKNQIFYNIYDFFLNDEIDKQTKFDFMKNYFTDIVKKNKDIECKLCLTYLRRILITDCENQDFCDIYSRILYDIRDSFLTNPY